MAITFVGANTGQISSTTVSIQVPSATQAGDLLLAFVVTGATTTVTCSGWTLLAATGASPNTQVLQRVATATDPGKFYAFSTGGSASTANDGAVLAYRAASTPTIDTFSASAQYNTVKSITAPVVTTGSGNEMVLEAWGVNTSSNPTTPPATNRVNTNGSGYAPLIISDQAQATAGAGAAQTLSVAASTTYTLTGSAITLALKSNNPPNAPTVQTASTIDSGASNVIAAPFSDPDPGDTCSQTDFQWWDLDGTGARVGAVHTQTVTGAQPTQWTAPAGTFTNGNKEIQAKSYDALGVASAWGPSAFFTAATPTGMPTITDPTNGATIGQTPYTVTWSTAGGQKGYRVRRVKDNAGSADATTVYWDSGQVTGAGADVVRSLSVPFETNNRYEHVQVSVTADGSLWSSWADARVNVSYTAPAAPTFSVDLDAASGSALVTITNPAPGTGQPSASYNVVEADDGDGKGFSTRPGSSMVAPNSSWRYWTPPSGFDPAGNVRVTTVATNGTTSSTTSPLNVTDGNSPANTTTTISDGGVVL